MNCLKRINNRKTLGRVSAFTFAGSLSVEAAMAAPFFLFAMMSIFSLFEVVYTDSVVQSAFYSAARKVAQESYVSPVLSGKRVEKYMEEQLSEANVSCGRIRCDRKIQGGTDSILDLSLQYQIELPIFYYHIPVVKREKELRVKGWTGYEGGEGAGKEEYVFITPTGIVYHTSPRCSYLDLTIRKEALAVAKKKYFGCSLCGKNPGGQVYVTTYGDVYHTSLNCSGLKRTIYAVKLSEVQGRGGCPKCTK